MDTERKQQEKKMELLERRKACREILADQIDGNIEKSNNLFYLNSKVSRKLVIWSLDSSTNILFYRVPSIPNFYVLLKYNFLRLSGVSFKHWSFKIFLILRSCIVKQCFG